MQGVHSFNHLIGNFEKNTSEDILEYYATSIRPRIKKLFPTGKDKTTIINGSVFINKEGIADQRYSNVFKKVLGKFRDYGKLEHIDYDFKSQLFEVFLKESISKKNLGQFFTPLKVVKAIVEMAKDEIKEGSKICDPACGVGKFLLEPVKTKLDQFYEIKKGKLIPKITIHGFDKGFDGEEQKTIILAKANMLIYFSDLIKDNPNITEDFSDLFNDSFNLKTNSILGTLSEPIENEYDLILTNPPYVTSGSSNLKEEINKDTELKNYYKINAMGVEGLFMEWIVRALKPSGKAFIVVPDGIFNRQNDKNLRKFILDECIIDGIISLPLKTFFTTNKKTYILCLTKKANKKDIQTEPVFTYLVSEIGESRDVYRFNIEQNDLEEAVNLYSFFKGNKTNFEKINKDPRCKIQPIEKFNPEIHWSIDRWWTKEEKISLGIAEEDKSIKFDELPDLIEEVANNILSFKEEILELSQKKKFRLDFKEFSVGELFDFPPIKGLTKEFINSNLGDIPVYGGKQFESPIGLIQDNLPSVKYFENCLAWNREGSVGYVFFHKHKFTTNDHHRPLILKDKYKNQINLDYARLFLEKLLLSQGFVWSKTASKEKVEKFSLQIPIKPNGEFDLEAQKAIAEKYKKIEQVKKSLSEELDKMLKIEIDYE